LWRILTEHRKISTQKKENYPFERKVTEPTAITSGAFIRAMEVLRIIGAAYQGDVNGKETN